MTRDSQATDKQDFHLYHSLQEIHARMQLKLQQSGMRGILLVLNTPGSLEKVLIHTNREKFHELYEELFDYVLSISSNGMLEIGYKLQNDDRFVFYVTAPGHHQDLPPAQFSNIRAIVAKLGGRIWTEIPPHATKTFFCFTIDIHKAASDMETVVPEKDTFPDWSDKTILIVDDVYNNCMLLEAFLGPTSATVIKANNGLKAVNEVKSNDQISFVLMDLRMPILDGYEATRRIKILKPWLPVIAISAHVTASTSDICSRAGCDAFLSKPFNISDLIKKMGVLFEKMQSIA